MNDQSDRRRDPAPVQGGRVSGPKPGAASKPTPKPEADTSAAGPNPRK
jgi:hypothetical protein